MPDFAALERRVNAASMSHCGNVSVTLPGGAVVQAVFDDSYEHEMGLANRRTTLLAQDSAGFAANQALTIRGVNYTVRRTEAQGDQMQLVVLGAA